MAFGADSIIELLSAAVLIWRLSVELRQGREFSERAEARASKLGAILLGALALYVVITSGVGLWSRHRQDVSIAGLVLAAIAIPTMYFLARTKIRITEKIGSRALRADAAESITCCYLSSVVVVGLLAQWFFEAWWIDSVTALVLVPFLVHEAREAWESDWDCLGDVAFCGSTLLRRGLTSRWRS